MPRTVAVPTISQVGDRLDLVVRQGSTLGPLTFTMHNPDDTPVDLTGCTISASVRKTANAYGAPAATPVMTIDADPTLGKFVMTIDDEITAAIPAGEFVSSPESEYYWDAEMQDSAGRVLPLYYGVFRVQPEASRPDVDAPTAPECCA